MSYPKNIKLIIFDLGGVLVTKNVEKIGKKMAQYLNITPLKYDTLYSTYKEKITEGRMNLFDFYLKLLNGIVNDANNAVAKHVEFHYNCLIKQDSRIIHLIKILKKNYKVFCLTNTQLEISEDTKKFGIYDYFDEAFISVEMGMYKPQLEIYESIIAFTRFLPEEIVFIDDKAENVKAARNIGMNGICYRSYNQLLKELEKIEVKK